MGTESDIQGEDTPPPNIKSKTDYVEAYHQLIMKAPNTCVRCKRRDVLRIPTLQFLRSVGPAEKLSQVTGEVLRQNVEATHKWEARKAMEVCRNLEDIVLRLWDQPWRKEYHVIKLYSGYFRTTVMQHLTDADRLLEVAGYQLDISGHQMVLSSVLQKRLLTAASELYLLGLECQVYREILCLVQVEGYTIQHVCQCRFTVPCDNDAAVHWIHDNCHKQKPNKKKTTVVLPEDPIYAEIEGSPSPASSSRSIKSSSITDVNNESGVPTPALSNSTANVDNLDLSEDDKVNSPQPQPEPIYSVVKKPPKKDSGNHKKSPSVARETSPGVYTSDSPMSPAPVASPAQNDVKQSPKRKARGQDSGYLSKPNSQELRTVEEGSYVKVDLLPESQGQSQSQEDEQYGFDKQGLQALRGSPRTHDMFRPATAEEHQLKSLQSVLLEIDSGNTAQGATENTAGDWTFVHEDLQRRLGTQRILGERGDILRHKRHSSSPTMPQSTPATGTSAVLKTERHSNLTFSTFRPPSQSPQHSQSPVIQSLANDKVQRSSSPYENLPATSATDPVDSWEIKRPPVTISKGSPSAFSAIPVKLPMAPELNSRTLTNYTSPPQKSFTESLEKRQSFYDNLPREETDSVDVVVIGGESGDRVLQLLEHTKERIERNLMATTAQSPVTALQQNNIQPNATVTALQQNNGEGVNCGPAPVKPPLIPTAPNHTASQCYYSVPDTERDPGLVGNKTSHTAPITGPSTTEAPPPQHMHMMGNHWQCECCTSFNLQGTEVCDICGKSRLKGAEQLPLTSGGPQCPKCTLINDIGASLCDACSYSFDRGVPTYI